MLRCLVGRTVGRGQTVVTPYQRPIHRSLRRLASPVPSQSNFGGLPSLHQSTMLGGSRSPLCVWLCATACMTMVPTRSFSTTQVPLSGGIPTDDNSMGQPALNRSQNLTAENILFEHLMEDGVNNGTRNRPMVLCGPSGVGKSYLIKRLMQRLPDKVGVVVSHTTRPPRENEVNGTSYHFVSRSSFHNMIAKGHFLEHDEIHGNLYGTSYEAIASVHRANRTCIMDMTIAGATEFAEACSTWQNRLGIPAPWIAYIRPPSIEELERWLRYRKSESEESLQKRLNQAKEELVTIDQLDIFDRIIVKTWVD